MPDTAPPARPTQSARDRTRWVRGEGRYVADLPAVDALAAAFLRAPVAHAEITAIDTAPARAIPGVVAVLTGEDCRTAGLANFRGLMPYGADGPRPLVVPRRPVLAEGRVRHVGELVACVIAETAALAADAAEAIDVRYRKLPAVVGIAAATRAPAIHPEAPGNLAFRHQAGDAAAVGAAVAAAAHVVTAELTLPRLAPTTMEPGGSIARYDAGRDVYQLVTPHQGINEIRLDLATVLDVPIERIEVTLPDVGGGFGLRSPATPEQVALLLAARRTGRAVRWVATRSEAFVADNHGRSTRLRGRLALDDAGRFTALEFDFDVDLGAYVGTVGALVNVHNPLQSGTGTYAIPVVLARFAQYFTNCGPIGPYRGAGRPDMALLLECLVERAAAVLGVDPLVLRAANAVPAAAFPYRTALGALYDSADYAALIAALRAAAGSDAAARRAAAAQRGRLFGRGFALFTEIAGGGATPRDEARVSLDLVDGRVTATIETVTGGSGQSQAETYALVLAGRIGIDPADVTLQASPPQSRLQGAGSIGSRSTVAVGNAVARAGAQLAERLRAQAGLRANAAPAELVITPGAVARADGSVVMTLAEAVAAATADGSTLVETGAMPVAATFPSGCHLAEVEIDPDTGALALTRYVAIDDAGVVLNPRVAAGQLQGGIVQGLGEVLGEGMRYDAAGQPLTGSFMDYAMPRADEVPGFELEDRQTPSPHNPLGVKGLGEAGTTGALAAAANAVADALRAVGAPLPDLPCTPERIWAALAAARRAG